MNTSKPLHVVIATPLGRGGQGGIDRIMDQVHDALKQNPEQNPLRYHFIVTRGQRGAAYSLVQLFIAIICLIYLRAHGRADLVHINLSSHGSTQRKMLLAWICRGLRIPYILHLHGSRMRQYWEGASAINKARVDSMFARANRIIVLGEIWRNFVVRRVPSTSSSIVILPNATKPFRLQRVRDNSRIRILFLGRLGKRKGVPELVEALAQIASVPGWHATIAGDGDIEGTRSHLLKHDIAHRVDLPGWVGPLEVDEALANSDILVLPSFDENLPMSVIEGMAAGLAVIATPVGATEEIVRHEETGLLVAAGDVDALATSLKTLIQDAALRERLGDAARKFHAQHLEISPYTSRLNDIWMQAVQS